VRLANFNGLGLVLRNWLTGAAPVGTPLPLVGAAGLLSGAAWRMSSSTARVACDVLRARAALFVVLLAGPAAGALRRRTGPAGGGAQRRRP
jgi:hypothetical protein